VGEPTSSVTTASAGRVRAASRILTGKFAPPEPNTHAVRATIASGFAWATAASPASFDAP